MIIRILFLVPHWLFSGRFPIVKNDCIVYMLMYNPIKYVLQVFVAVAGGIWQLQPSL